MNFLVDESVDRQVVERLRQDGHDIAYAAEGGLTLDELQDAIETIAARLPLEAAALAAYDPAADEESKGPAVACQLIDTILAQ